MTQRDAPVQLTGTPFPVRVDPEDDRGMGESGRGTARGGERDESTVADRAAAARDAVAAAARRVLADAGADATPPAWAESALPDRDSATADGHDDDPETVADRVAARLVARTLLAALGADDGRQPMAVDSAPAPARDPGPPKAAADPLADLAGAVERAPDGSEAVARAYGAVVPPARRRARGEYYTPRPVRDLLARLCVTAPDDRVLDPACGTGGFLASAARRKRALSSENDDAIDTGATSALVGVEVAPEPARLAAAALPADVRVADFFDVAPGALGGPFDAVLGNPPYVRHEAIPDDAAVRAHLDRVGAAGLSRRADLYAYFLTRATELLAPGGDLGFVTSDRWLDTRYGEDLQRFLLDNVAVRAVVTFDAGVFEDALVDAALVVVRRREDAAARDRTVTRFVRVRSGVDAGDRAPDSRDAADAGAGGLDAREVAALVTRDRPPDRLADAPGHRVATRRQAALRAEAKWNAYHLAPPVYFELRAHSDTVPLSTVADVRYGVKTGANDFFVGRTGAFAERGLDPYAAPFLKATGQVGTVAVRPADADGWRVLDAHDAVLDAHDAVLDAHDAADAGSPGDAGVSSETGAAAGPRSETDAVRALSAAGHGALARHVARGERAGYHERPSLASREPWFDLGPLPRPRLLATTFTWRVHRVHWNAARAVPGDQFYAVVPDGVDPELLGGVLNSRAVWLASEVLGRRAGGEGMTRLQTKVYEARRWPVPDPRAMDAERREAVRRAFRALRERELAESTTEPTAAATAAERDALDRAVLGALDVERDVGSLVAEVKRGVRTMVARRAGERPAPEERSVEDLPPVDGGD